MLDESAMNGSIAGSVSAMTRPGSRRIDACMQFDSDASLAVYETYNGVGRIRCDENERFVY
jgi:hypothetical protein